MFANRAPRGSGATANYARPPAGTVEWQVRLVKGCDDNSSALVAIVTVGPPPAAVYATLVPELSKHRGRVAVGIRTRWSINALVEALSCE